MSNPYVAGEVGQNPNGGDWMRRVIARMPSSDATSPFDEGFDIAAPRVFDGMSNPYVAGAVGQNPNGGDWMRRVITRMPSSDTTSPFDEGFDIAAPRAHWMECQIPTLQAQADFDHCLQA
ncbi:MAG: hypothetical protein WBP29_13175 [Candidatus Zixiibacteriota bacterium]